MPALTQAAVEAMTEWYLAHDAYHKASEAYNRRLALVRSERDRGNWSMTVDAEYKALNEAQSAALAADETFYRACDRELARLEIDEPETEAAQSAE